MILIFSLKYKYFIFSLSLLFFCIRAKKSKTDNFAPDPDLVDDPYFSDPVLELNPDQATPISLHTKPFTSSSRNNVHIVTPIILIKKSQPCYHPVIKTDDPIGTLVSNLIHGKGCEKNASLNPKTTTTIFKTSKSNPATFFTSFRARTINRVPISTTTTTTSLLPPLSASNPLLPPNLLLPLT